ncbi:MAG: hypothetical protein IJJ06_08130 [Mogibacterium sp.]|nr:hypothetical protein [Mogibacterium sp.]
MNNNKKIIILLAAAIICCVLVLVIKGLTIDNNPIEEEPVAEDSFGIITREENSSAESDNTSEELSEEPEGMSANDVPDVDYQVDCNYVLQEDRKVYDGASYSARWKKRTELSENAQDHAASDDNAILEKNTVVTCLEIDGNWMRIPSGWICCREDDKVYVTDSLTISDEDIKETGSNSPGTIYGINGDLICDDYEMIPSDQALNGKYTIKRNSYEKANETVRVDFSGDGTCIIEYSEEIPNWTDEEGNWSGCKYTVKDNTVYIRKGGTQSISAYEIGDGRTLEFLYEASSTKIVYFN